MFNVRKIIALILSIIFCAAIIVGIGVIFAVKNVNVEYIDYSGSCESEFEKTKDKLNELKGSSILFVGDSEVSAKLSDGGRIAVVSYDRIFPCTLNVVLRERVEKFAVKTEEGYAIYDESGKYMRSSEVNINRVDSSPDVLIDAQPEDIEAIAEVCSFVSAEENFGSLRNVVESVSINHGIAQASDTLVINMRSGLKLLLVDWRVAAKEKIAAIYKKYCAVSESERLSGSITAYSRGGEAPIIEAEWLPLK